MNIRKQVKQNARRALSGNWGKVICIFLITAAIYIIFALMQGVLSLIFNIPDFNDIFSSYQYLNAPVIIPPITLIMAAVFAVFSLIVNSPLMFGIKGWYYRMISGECGEIGTVFAFFSNMRLLLKTIWHDIVIAIRTVLWSIVFAVIPGTICGFGALILNNPAYTDLYRLGGILLLILGGLLAVLSQIFIMIFTKRYFLSAYLIVEDNSISVHKAIKTSVRYTKGSRFEIFVFHLSFLPWMVLSIFLLPLLYVAPYYGSANALYAKYLIERGKLNENEQRAVKNEQPSCTEAEAPQDSSEDTNIAEDISGKDEADSL